MKLSAEQSGGVCEALTIEGESSRQVSFSSAFLYPPLYYVRRISSLAHPSLLTVMDWNVKM